MSLRIFFVHVFYVSLILGFAHHSLANDIIRIIQAHSELDKRYIYSHALLHAILENTRGEHGDYEIQLVLTDTQRNRALVEILSGETINVHVVPTKAEWEEKTIPIRIPVRKGLLGYRLFLIHKDKQETFSAIKELDELKSLRAGLRQQWSTTKAMQTLGFNVVTGSDYEGLFGMLATRERFDYFPRGVNEVFTEYKTRKDIHPEIRIEQNKALYLPLPTYIFVSPAFPSLAIRLEKGLQRIVEDGSFDVLFMEHHRDSICEANLAMRQIFYVDNPLLTPETPFHVKEFWLDPLGVSCQ